MGRSSSHRRMEPSKHKTRAEKARLWTLDEWVVFFHNLYGEVNQNVSPAILWLNAVDEATKLTEYVRRDKPSQAVDRVARLFGWTCAFVGKYLKQEDFEAHDPIKTLLRDRHVGHDFNRQFRRMPESYLKWVLWKYPTACTVCGGRPCECGIRRALVEARKAKPGYDAQFAENQRRWARNLKREKRGFRQAEFELYRKKSLDELIDEFIYIYGGGHTDVNLWNIAAHLLEEVGEVASGILALEELQEDKLREMELEHLVEALQEAWAHYVDVKLRENARTDAEYTARHARVVRDCTIQEDDGLPSKLLVNLNNWIGNDPMKAATFLRDCAVQDLKGELADVFSWISAFLHKVGEGWRAYREEEKWYSFADSLVKDCANKEGNLVCPRCGDPECTKGCLLRGFFYMILREVGEMELREERAL